MADEDIRPNLFFSAFDHVVIFLARATSKTNVYTHKKNEHADVESFSYDCHVRGLRFIPGGKKKKEKISSFFLDFVSFHFLFCFIVYDFYFLFLFFFSATHKTRASFILFPSRHVFTLVRHPPYNITLINVLIRTLSIFSWFQLILLLQATPFANSWFSPSYRHHHRHAAHAGKHHRTRSLTDLYFQASLYTNYFINILLISVPHNLNIT